MTGNNSEMPNSSEMLTTKDWFVARTKNLGSDIAVIVLLALICIMLLAGIGLLAYILVNQT